MNSIYKRKEAYEKIGLKVVFMYAEEIWTDSQSGKLRPNFEKTLLSKIGENYARYKSNSNNNSKNYFSASVSA